MDAEINPSSSAIFTFSEARMYIPRGPLSVCFIGETRLSSVIPEIKVALTLIVGVKFHYLLYGPCVRYRPQRFSVVPYTSLPVIFSDFSSLKNVFGYCKFPQTSVIGFLFGDL